MKGTCSVLEIYHRTQEGPNTSPLVPLKALFFFIWEGPLITLSPAFPQVISSNTLVVSAPQSGMVFFHIQAH